jgi:ABC-type nitrate/sulfonate/bicarbonate transport system substrate-binding protein
LSKHRELVRQMIAATARGYVLASRDPAGALDDLLAENAALDRDQQDAELRALRRVHAFEPVGRFDRHVLDAWANWEVERGILDRRPDVANAFWMEANG